MLFSVLLLYAYFTMTSASLAGGYMPRGAQKDLPIKVKIIDFQTTKALCIADNAPSWCPSHLLKGYEATTAETKSVTDIANAIQPLKSKKTR